MSTEDYQEKIARGVALLDEDNPGWRDKIDLTLLRMGNPGTCVLGQAYFPTPYGDTVQRLTGKVLTDSTHEELDRWSVDHGFNVYYDEYMGELQKAWREELRKQP